MTSPVDLDALQALAEAAGKTNPGGWYAAVQRGKVPLVGCNQATDAKCVAVFGAAGNAGRDAARYIGALGPDVVLALIAHIRELEATGETNSIGYEYTRPLTSPCPSLQLIARHVSAVLSGYTQTAREGR